MSASTDLFRRPPTPGSGLALARRRHARHLCTLLFAAGLTTVSALAQSPLEVGVKAAYLYKFLTFVEWPVPAAGGQGAARAGDAPLTIGVIGADPLHAELQKIISGRHVNGRPLTLRRLAASEATDNLDALYIGREATTAAVLNAVKGRPLLVVTDVPGGLPEGAMLNFLLVDGRVRFEASAVNAERAGLRLSARLLAVAERVVSP